ncbi:MAG TPA: MarR family transcriptional regulator [Thermomicrobiales bacterium]|jgi:DNA-binding MarR family transcriptional regulator
MSRDSDLATDLVLALEGTVPRYLRSLRQAVEQAEGPDRLTMQQVRCLQALAAEDEAALTTGLARRLKVAVPTMTRMLDGLAERGLVERQPDPTSRRQVRIVLTESGRVLLGRYEAVISARLRRLIARLDREQQERLLRAVGDVAAALDADADGDDDEGGLG